MEWGTVVPKAAKADPTKVASEIESMKQDLKALQEALGQLVDAMITEEKPGLKEIKKLKTSRSKL
jgi:CHAD domain-containing protein